MHASDLAFSDATDIAGRIRTGACTSVACLEMYLERISRHNPALNAIVVPDFERARQQARAADDALAAGRQLGPLHGVPMTIKESFDVEGLPTTFGSPEYKDSRAASDAAVVARLKAAGAVIIGKTNVPLRLVDFQSYNEVYGTTNNPWDLTRTPGGSSGGESAALAAGLCALGCGSDIGSSLRNPAHYTGIFAHKPTYGIVSHEGHSPVPAAAPMDLGVYGPLARSARDLGLALQVMAGPGTLAAHGWRLELPRPTKPLSQLRVAVWADDPLAPVSREVSGRCEDVAQTLARAGAEVANSARPGLSATQAHACYQKLLMSALSIRRPQEELYAACRAASRHDPADSAPAASQAWTRVMPHRMWLELNEQRTRLRLAWREFFQQWDLVICPAAPTTAFAHDHAPFERRTVVVDGEPRNYFGQLFWAGLATLCYLPSTVIPTGQGRDGLPIGVQLMGAEFNDLLTIDAAQQLEGLGYTFVAPPGYARSAPKPLPAGLPGGGLRR